MSFYDDYLKEKNKQQKNDSFLQENSFIGPKIDEKISEKTTEETSSTIIQRKNTTTKEDLKYFPIKEDIKEKTIFQEKEELPKKSQENIISEQDFNLKTPESIKENKKQNQEELLNNKENKKQNKKSLKFNVKNLILITLMVGSISTLIYLFLFSKNKIEVVEGDIFQEDWDIPEDSHDLIKNDLGNGNIDIDYATKQMFYAVFDIDKLDLKYHSDEVILFPDFDDFLNNHIEDLEEETILEIFEYLALPNIRDDLVIKKEDGEYRVIKEEKKVGDSLLVPRVKASHIKQNDLDSILITDHFNIFFSKRNDETDVIKNMGDYFDHVIEIYLDWGYVKPETVYIYNEMDLFSYSDEIGIISKELYRDNENRNFLSSISDKDIKEALLKEGRIAVYIVEDLRNPGWLATIPPWYAKAVSRLVIFLDYLTDDMDTTAAISILNQRFYPHIVIDYDYYINEQDTYGKDIFKSKGFFPWVISHEIFHLVQDGIKSNAPTNWKEQTAQWAAMQLNPNNTSAPRRFLQRYMKENHLFSINDEDMKYSPYTFPEFVSIKFGRNFIKESLMQEDWLEHIAERSGNYPQFFHEFALKNYLIDFDKKAITYVRNYINSPKSTYNIFVRDKDQSYTDIIPIERSAIHHIDISFQYPEKIKSFEIEIKTKDGQDSNLYASFLKRNIEVREIINPVVGPINMRAEGFETIKENFSINSGKKIGFNNIDYSSLIIVISNGDYHKNASDVDYIIRIIPVLDEELINSSIDRDLKYTSYRADYKTFMNGEHSMNMEVFFRYRSNSYEYKVVTMPIINGFIDIMKATAIISGEITDDGTWTTAESNYCIMGMCQEASPEEIQQKTFASPNIFLDAIKIDTDKVPDELILGINAKCARVFMGYYSFDGCVHPEYEIPLKMKFLEGDLSGFEMIATKVEIRDISESEIRN